MQEIETRAFLANGTEPEPEDAKSSFVIAPLMSAA